MQAGQGRATEWLMRARQCDGTTRFNGAEGHEW